MGSRSARGIRNKGGLAKAAGKMAVGGVSVSDSNLVAPKYNNVIYGSASFVVPDDEQVLAHYTRSSSIKSILKDGLIAGDGKPGSFTSAGSTDLWAWSNPQDVINAKFSTKESVVVFLTKKSNVRTIPDSSAVILRSKIPAGNIHLILKGTKK